jgi:hypothetical protein
MAKAVASNPLLKSISTQLWNFLNAGHWFQLFQNNIIPTPDTTVRDFYEANFSGYNPFNLAGTLVAPIETFTGQYQIDGNAGPFACESGTQIVYGAFISDLKSLKLSVRFDSPFTFLSGSLVTFPLAILTDAISII